MDGTLVNACGTNESRCLANRFEPYLKYVKEIIGIPNNTSLEGCWNNNELPNPHEVHVCVITNDGLIYDFDREGGNCENDIKCAYINVDVNGLKGPNKWGLDRYGFIYYANRGIVPRGMNSVFCNEGNGEWTENMECAAKYLFFNK